MPLPIHQDGYNQKGRKSGVGENAEKLEFAYIAGGNVKSHKRTKETGAQRLRYERQVFTKAREPHQTPHERQHGQTSGRAQLTPGLQE